jgi:hypothetical protein
MNTFKRLFSFAAIVALSAIAALAQSNTLTATTLSAAALATDKTLFVTSATGINAPNLQNGTIGSQLYVVAPGARKGEVMPVISTNGTAISVRRSGAGASTAFPNGSMVLVGTPNMFYSYDPSGGCTAANTFVTPWINVKTGAEWLCSTVTLSWVAGFQGSTAEQGVTALVASVAGATAVNGPLQHISGTNAITSFTMGPGWNGSGFCVIPDGAFTTTATNNIAKASTAVANKTLCWAWDNTNSVFTPSY